MAKGAWDTWTMNTVVSVGAEALQKSSQALSSSKQKQTKNEVESLRLISKLRPKNIQL